jgi:hypothetical protein
MSIRSVDEWRKIVTDLTPNEAANKIVAALDPAARTVYTQVVIGNALAAFAVANGKRYERQIAGDPISGSSAVFMASNLMSVRRAIQ